MKCAQQATDSVSLARFIHLNCLENYCFYKQSMLWVELCPPTMCIFTEVLTSGTSECDLIRTQGCCRYNKDEVTGDGLNPV